MSIIVNNRDLQLNNSVNVDLFQYVLERSERNPIRKTNLIDFLRKIAFLLTKAKTSNVEYIFDSSKKEETITKKTQTDT